MTRKEMADSIIRKFGFEAIETIEFFELLEKNCGRFYDAEYVSDIFEILMER